jgi:hypothetical protein
MMACAFVAGVSVLAVLAGALLAYLRQRAEARQIHDAGIRLGRERGQW